MSTNAIIKLILTILDVFASEGPSIIPKIKNIVDNSDDPVTAEQILALKLKDPEEYI
jgi:hypothetical protein